MRGLLGGFSLLDSKGKPTTVTKLYESLPGGQWPENAIPESFFKQGNKFGCPGTEQDPGIHRFRTMDPKGFEAIE
jgi:hypothetical protein